MLELAEKAETAQGPSVYRVLWKRVEFDDWFSHRVSALSLEEAIRSSLLEIDCALGRNAKLWMIREVLAEAPSTANTGLTVSLGGPKRSRHGIVPLATAVSFLLILAFWLLVKYEIGSSKSASEKWAEQVSYAELIAPSEVELESLEESWISGRIFPTSVIEVLAPETGIFRWDPSALGPEVAADEVVGKLTAEGAADDVQAGVPIVAPAPGMIVSNSPQLATFVRKSARLFQVVDYTTFVFRTAPRVGVSGRLGELCEVWSAGGFSSTAEILSSHRALHGFEVFLRLKGANLALVPGSRVRLCISQRVLRKELYLPRSAVDIRDSGAQVALVSKNRVHFCDVELGAANGNRIEIVKGLSADSQVIASFPQQAREGSLVESY